MTEQERFIKSYEDYMEYHSSMYMVAEKVEFSNEKPMPLVR